MDVRMPDGTIVTNVPDNITQEDLLSAYSSYTPEPVRENPIYGVAANVTPSLATGIGSVIQLPGKLADLITGTAPGEKAGGIRTLVGSLIPGGAKAVQEAGSGLESIGQAAKTLGLQQKEKERAEKVEQAEGQLNKFGTAFYETITDPTLISSFIFEQIPNTVGSWGFGLLGKAGFKAIVAGASEQAAARAGLSTAVGSSVAMQGTDIGYNTYKDIYERLIKEGMSPVEANTIASQKGVVAGIEGGALSYATSRIPGARELEKIAFRKASAPTGALGKAAIIKGGVRGAGGETLSENIEEIGGQFASNIGKQEVFPETRLTEGLGEAGAMATIGGSTLGGGAGALNARAEGRAQQRLTEEAAIAEANAKRNTAVNEALKGLSETEDITTVQSPVPLNDPSLEFSASTEINGVKTYTYIKRTPKEVAVQPEPELFGSREPLPQDILDQGYRLVEQREEDGQPLYVYVKEEPVAEVAAPVAAPITETPAQLSLVEEPASETPSAEVGFGKASPELKSSVSALEKQMKDLGLDITPIVDEVNLFNVSVKPLTEAQYYTRLKYAYEQEINQAAQPKDVQPVDPNVEARLAVEPIEPVAPSEPPAVVPKRVPKAVAPKAGEKILSAHEYIASLGGLNKKEAPEIDKDAAKSNVKIGNKWLYASKGGLSASEAAERLVEAKYMQVEDNNLVYQIIQNSLTNPIYSLNDADVIAERKFAEQAAEEADRFAKKEAEAGVEAQEISTEIAAEQAVEAADLGNFRQQMLDAGYTEQDLNVIGFTKASPELQAEVAALEKQVSEAGLDPSEILEVLNRTYGDQLITKQEYYAKAKSELAKAITQAAKQGGRGDVSQANVPTPPEAKATESLDKFLEINGFTFLPSDSKRNFQDFPTFEKDGVRVALSNNALGYSKGRVMMITPFGKFANSITVQALIVDQDKRNQGKAREVMQLLSDRADDTETTLYVEPLPINDKSVKTEGLKKFYASLGFEPKGEKIMIRNPGSKGLVAPTQEDLKAKQEAADQAAADKAKADREADAKAKADQDRKDIAARSEKAAGEFELGKSAEEDLSGQKDVFSTPVQISPEQQKIDALNKFEERLSNTVPPFRGAIAARAFFYTPKPLSDKQIALIKDLASEAIDLGMPASLLEDILASGATRMSAVAAIASKRGWLVLGSQWSSASRTEKLQAIIHELGHSVDNTKKRISDGDVWQKAHDELKKWHDSSNTPREHPLAYPFNKQFSGKLKLNRESFAQAFSLYFVSPVELQTNAPEAYSQIQSIVEEIQNESQRAGATGARKTDATGVEVQPVRATKDTAVQSKVGEVGSGVRQTERIKDRDAQDLDKIQLPAAKPAPAVPSTGTPRMNILGAPIAGTWTAAPETTLTPWIYKLQDKQVDLKDAQKQIEKTVGKIDDALNAYRKETLYYGRVADQTERFLNEELKPLLKDMMDKKLTLDEVDKYLQALHAEERNKSIAKRVGGMPDGGAGISTAGAQAYLDSLSPQEKADLQDISDRVRKIISGTQEIEVSGGLELQSKIDGWNKAWPNYVPLFRDEVDYVNSGSGMGQGFSTRGGSSKRAVGSDKPVKEIIASLAEQRQKAIVRSEKARVGKALYALAIANPNPDYWLAIDPNSKEDIKKVEQMLQDYGFDPGDIAQLIKNMAQEPRTGSVKRVFNPVTKQFDEVVKYDINTQNRYSSNVLPIRINGEDKFLFFNPSNDRAKRMAESIKNLDAEQLAEGMQTIGNVTRFIAALSTQYNPIFGAINFARDVQGAMLNLSTTPLRDKKAEVASGAFKAMKGIWAEVRARRSGKQASGYYSDLYREFESEGGKTGFINQFNNLNKKGSVVERELKGLTQGRVKGAVSFVGNWLSDYNDTLENAVRLSAYEQGVKMGLSKEESAEIAKNLTVNFNRKGAKTAWLGALYAFFNSAVQGTARLYETLRGPAGKKIIAGGFLLGAFQAALLAMAGFDEDEPSEFIKQKNFVIPTLSGGYIMIPMPLGFNVIPNVGRIISEIAFGSKKSGTRKIGDLMEVVLSSFNPLGSGNFTQMIVPTIGDPIANVMNNRDSFGRPISREDRAMNPSPGYLRSRESAGVVSKGIAEFLNYVSGGTEFNKGTFSPTGDDINYVVGQYLGGVGREIMRAKEFASSFGKDEPFEPYKVPVLGKVYGDINAPASVANKFYLNVKQMAEHENEIKGRKGSAISEYMRENPDSRLYRTANRLENDISKLNKTKKEYLERNAPEASIRRIEDQKLRVMKQFNDQVRKLQ